MELSGYWFVDGSVKRITVRCHEVIVWCHSVMSWRQTYWPALITAVCFWYWSVNVYWFPLLLNINIFMVLRNPSVFWSGLCEPPTPGLHQTRHQWCVVGSCDSEGTGDDPGVFVTAAPATVPHGNAQEENLCASSLKRGRSTDGPSASWSPGLNMSHVSDSMKEEPPDWVQTADTRCCWWTGTRSGDESDRTSLVPSEMGSLNWVSDETHESQTSSSLRFPEWGCRSDPGLCWQIGISWRGPLKTWNHQILDQTHVHTHHSRGPIRVQLWQSGDPAGQKLIQCRPVWHTEVHKSNVCVCVRVCVYRSGTDVQTNIQTGCSFCCHGNRMSCLFSLVQSVIRSTGLLLLVSTQQRTGSHMTLIKTLYSLNTLICSDQ